MNPRSNPVPMPKPAERPGHPGQVVAIPIGTAWQRYVAVGDSLTEGLSDTSRQEAGSYRGWADRLAMLLAQSTPSKQMLYANLAVRSQRISGVLDVQIPRAIDLAPDLVSILIGGNDLMWFQTSPVRLARELTEGVTRLRRSGCDVLLVTPFTPPHPYLRGVQGRFERFNRAIRSFARESDCLLLDFWTHPEFQAKSMWGVDRVHLSAQGHRTLAYRAARVLGVPDAAALGALEAAVHRDVAEPSHDAATARWLWTHARPWLGRRLLGRTAGDGRAPKNWSLVPVFPSPRMTVTSDIPQNVLLNAGRSEPPTARG